MTDLPTKPPRRTRAIIVAVAAAMLLAGAAAGATSTRFLYLHQGDRALAVGGDTQCRVVKLDGTPGFRCYVGGDYRAKYGVLIGSAQVAVIEYSSLDSYRVVLRKRQAVAGP